MAMHLLSKLRKIRSMRPAEIRFRLQAALWEGIALLRFKCKVEPYAGDRISHIADGLLDGVAGGRTRDRFFTETIDRSTHIALLEEALDHSDGIVQSDRLLHGDIDLLGWRCRIPYSGGWHQDPVTGTDWPRVFHAWAKKQPPVENADIKYVWEVNRHQYLIALGKGYWLTGDERYAARVAGAITSWIDENPYNLGVNWTSSLELAVRTISWLWAIFFCRGSNHMDPAFTALMARSVCQQAHYIERHLSYYSSPYNHLIGEAAALHLIGSLFRNVAAGRRWERLGWSILVDTVDSQFHEDGMSVEQATFYHHFTLGFYLQAIFLRRNNNRPIPAALLDRIEKALELVMHLTKPDGTLPMIGDIDNARSLYFEPSHKWDFRGFLGLGAILFNRADFKHQSGGLSEEVLWLASQVDIDRFQKIRAVQPADRSVAFYRSGYFVDRDRWTRDANYWCFDCGEIAAGLSGENLPSAAHGHADALSFELVVHGRSFIVDGGFYTYFGDLAWHRYFRQESAHNTVQVENHRQADYCGRLTWQHVRSPELRRWVSTPDFVSMTGSMRLSAKNLHQRQMVYCREHAWLLKDTVSRSATSGRIQSFLHFAPDVTLELVNDRQELIATAGSTGLWIKYFGEVDLDLKRGGRAPDDGWVAHGYGIRHPAWRAVFSWRRSVPGCSSLIVMVPFRVGADRIDWHGERTAKAGLPDRVAFSRCGIDCSIELAWDEHFRCKFGERRFQVPMDPYVQ